MSMGRVTGRFAARKFCGEAGAHIAPGVSGVSMTGAAGAAGVAGVVGVAGDAGIAGDVGVAGATGAAGVVDGAAGAAVCATAVRMAATGARATLAPRTAGHDFCKTERDGRRKCFMGMQSPYTLKRSPDK